MNFMSLWALLLAHTVPRRSGQGAGGRVTVAQLIPSKNAAVASIASVWSVWSWLSSSQQLFLPPSKCWLMFGPGYLEHCSGPAVRVRVLKALRVVLFPTLVGKLCRASLYNRNILDREVTCNESIHRVGVWYPGKTTFRSYPSQYYWNWILYTMIQLSPNSLQRYSGFLGFLHLPLNLPQCPHRMCRT